MNNFNPAGRVPLVLRQNDSYPGTFPVQYVTTNFSSEQQKLQNSFFLENAKTVNKMALKAYENRLELDKEMVRSQLQEERAENRELTVKALVEDSCGDLCIETTNSKGVRKVSQPLSKARSFKSFILVSANTEKSRDLKKILKVLWQGETDGILLSLDDGAVQQIKLIKKLEEKGVTLKIPRRDKKELEEFFLGWLIDKSEIVKIPEHIGWNQLEDGAWFFEKNPEKTLEGICDD